MGKSTIGKLEEKLVLRTGTELIVIPRGTIMEISSEDEYNHNIAERDMEDAANYLKAH